MTCIPATEVEHAFRCVVLALKERSRAREIEDQVAAELLVEMIVGFVAVVRSSAELADHVPAASYGATLISALERRRQEFGALLHQLAVAIG